MLLLRLRLNPRCPEVIYGSRGKVQSTERGKNKLCGITSSSRRRGEYRTLLFAFIVNTMGLYVEAFPPVCLPYALSLLLSLQPSRFSVFQKSIRVKSSNNFSTNHVKCSDSSLSFSQYTVEVSFHRSIKTKRLSGKSHQNKNRK